MFNDLLYGGIKVIESPHCMVTEPIKKHEKRRTQSEQYHKRIQKRWTKKYGTKQVPGCFMMQDGILGNEQVIVAHPDVVKAMRLAI